MRAGINAGSFFDQTKAALIQSRRLFRALFSCDFVDRSCSRNRPCYLRRSPHSVGAPFAMIFISFLIASSSAPVRSQLVPILRNRTMPSWSIMM